MKADSPRAPLDLALLFDSPDENWPSMDLVGEMLLEQWRSTCAQQVRPCRVSIAIPPVVRRLPGAAQRRAALNADRALARYVAYPLVAWSKRRPGRLFHVVDHSYAQLVHVLPAARTGVYCHDLDALRPVLERGSGRRSTGARMLAWTLMRGVRAAALVFHSTRAIGRALEEHRLVPRSRLVHAPYGVAPEFNATPDADDGADGVLTGLRGRPFILHVGSEIPRKRLDVVFETFARLRARYPPLMLVQQGARLSVAQQAHVDRLGIRDGLIQPPKLERRTLAGLYRRASLVLVTSDAEGFGFPVIEAMACGSPVIASDIEVLREVGADAAVYAPAGDVDAWTAVSGALLDGRAVVPPRAARTERASRFTWERHARTILGAYQDLVSDPGGRGASLR